VNFFSSCLLSTRNVSNIIELDCFGDISIYKAFIIFNKKKQKQNIEELAFNLFLAKHIPKKINVENIFQK
jgi:hypothetical protein